MRVTFQSINRNTQSVIQGRYADLARLQQRMATGNQLTRPSDGAIETANVLRFRTQAAQLEQYETNINDGLAWLGFTDINMTSMGSILDRIKELAIQGNTDTLSPTERAYIVNEVEQLTLQMVSIVNQRYKGDFIFSGAAIDSPPVILRESQTTQVARAQNEMAFFNAIDPITGDPLLSAQIRFPNGRDATRIIPGSMEITAGGQKMQEGIDFSVDYMSGRITLLDLNNQYAGNPNAGMVNPAFDTTLPPSNNSEFIADPSGNGKIIRNPNYDSNLLNPNPKFVQSTIPHPMAERSHFNPAGGYDGSFAMRFNYLDSSVNRYNETIDHNSRILRKIESGVSLPINATIEDFGGIDGLFGALIGIGQGLLQGNQSGVNSAKADLENVRQMILSTQATIGATVNRFDSTLERNELHQVEIARLRSSLEDACLATTVADFAVLQTVFQAALQSTARIMQMSLADFIR